MSGVLPRRVFFDSDTVIAGSASTTGAAHALLALSELGIVRGFVSAQVVDECRRNLEKKIPAALPALNAVIARSVEVQRSPSANWMAAASRHAHPKDVPILAAALQARASYLVTFNVKDFHPPRNLKIEILRPGEMLDKIRRDLSGES
jgi:predicted nucleic acid-binding protein